MDADKSRPVRRPAAAAAKRAPVRRPRKLARPELDAGPQRDVRDLLHHLHEKADRPTLEDLERRIAADSRLDGSPRKDLIHRIISRGGPAALDDVRAVARTLARACGKDEHTIDAQVTLLMRSPERPSAPEPLLSPRSAYLAQVRQIAPPALVGREAELEELARFCLDEQAGAYVWWQAGPWAGKSALLSTFVLNPPETVRSRVQVVAFFITARLAAQDTRQAFTTVVGEQLAALTGQQVPAGLDESLREAWLLDLLDQAADGCRQQGMRLVLLVDGLDEDRGITTGPHTRSIAALLPGVPLAGMRVIVAGRPNPPVPDDVLDWHPLREQGIIRPLADSPHARDLQRLGQAELKRLVKGTQIEQDLLGLVTAARGGLSGEDLQELIGAGLADVEDVLHTVAGRTFTRRTQHWAGENGALVYLLGHEELDAAARRYLGGPRLTGYRDRLHTRADRYRRPDDRPAWPAGTPEYLLRGYPRMLRTNDDLPRLVALATDPARHDRMLDLTGGDAAALDEITTCQDLILAGPKPDLDVMLRLSIRRNNLTDRNTTIPTNLPAVWATLGEPARAEALARSLDPYRQVQALAEVVLAAAAAGDHDHARQMSGTAEALAYSLTGRSSQAQALAEVAVAVAVDRDRALQMATAAESLTLSSFDPSSQALAEVVRAVAAAGDLDRAETLARSLDPSWQAWALAEVARAVAAAGDFDRAEALAYSLTDPSSQARALAEVAHAVAVAGNYYRAMQMANTAEELAISLDPFSREQALAEVVRAVAAAGELDQAQFLACSLTDQSSQVRALAEAIRASAADGFYDSALRLATTAQAVAHSLDPSSKAQALVDVAHAIADVGDQDWAGQLLGAAFAVGPWLTPLPVLAQHWPQVVLRSVDVMSGNARL